MLLIHIYGKFQPIIHAGKHKQISNFNDIQKSMTLFLLILTANKWIVWCIQVNYKPKIGNTKRKPYHDTFVNNNSKNIQFCFRLISY
jgi:hypothetical protein